MSLAAKQVFPNLNFVLINTFIEQPPVLNSRFYATLAWLLNTGLTEGENIYKQDCAGIFAKFQKCDAAF